MDPFQAKNWLEKKVNTEANVRGNTNPIIITEEITDEDLTQEVCRVLKQDLKIKAVKVVVGVDQQEVCLLNYWSIDYRKKYIIST